MEEKLREDFPVDWEEDHYVSRREFFKFLTLASGGLAVGSAVMAGFATFSRDQRPMQRRLVTQASSLPVGGSLSFNYPREHDMCILVHHEEGQFVAYSQRCTHLSCPVNYEHDKQRLFCPCHNGAFAVADGRVTQGPPPRPLPQIMLEIDGDNIYAIGVKRGSEV
jgi:nitrite reductase/ring-hydroxylating ferredoxin subunit